MEVIIISGIFMSLFIFVLLLTKKQKALSDKILAALFVFIGLTLLTFYIYENGYYDKLPHLIGIAPPLPLFFGPLIFLYTKYSLQNSSRIKPIDYLHLSPPIIAYLYMTRFFVSYTAAEKIMINNGEIPCLEYFSLVLLIAVLVSGLVYSVLSFLLTVKHKKKVLNNYSYHEGINLIWLRNSIFFIALVFISAIAINMLQIHTKINLPFESENIIYLIIVSFVFYIGYFGIKQENIFSNNPENKNKTNAQKYKNSNIPKTEAEEIYQNLIVLMDNDKPYLEARLSLSKLSNMLNISSNQLSQIINQQSGVNFYDFVNQYRIEEFIKLAKENTKLNILALAYDAGFNSKSSFNNIFKKHKGVTPSKYISLNNQEKVK